MCQQLTEIREAIGRFAKCFDARSLLGAEAARVVDEAAAIERMIGAVKALAVARVDEAKGWADAPHRSPAEALSHRTGISRTEAKDILDAGKRLVQQPDLADAALAGKLSSAQTSLIAQAVEADPGAAGRLIEAAGESSLAELKDEVARTKAAVTDLEERRRLIHRRRRLRSWIDQDGGWHLNGFGNPEDGAQVMAALGPIQEEIFRQARKQGRRESPDAYAFDSLVQLAVESTSEGDDAPGVARQSLDSHANVGTGRDNAGGYAGPHPEEAANGATPAGNALHLPGLNTDDTVEPEDDRADVDDDLSDDAQDDDRMANDAGVSAPESESKQRPVRRRRRSGAPVKLLLRVDYDAWLRGVTAPGETCELAGYGPIPLSVAQELVERGDPFVVAILTKGQALVGVAHLGRRPTVHQQSALEWLYPTCAVKGCTNRARLERDHQIDWAKTHYTMFDLLDLLCRHHHRLKTMKNWALVPGRGKRLFVPPTDPRHPDYQGGDRTRPSQQRRLRPPTRTGAFRQRTPIHRSTPATTPAGRPNLTTVSHLVGNRIRIDYQPNESPTFVLGAGTGAVRSNAEQRPAAPAPRPRRRADMAAPAVPRHALSGRWWRERGSTVGIDGDVITSAAPRFLVGVPLLDCGRVGCRGDALDVGQVLAVEFLGRRFVAGHLGVDIRVGESHDAHLLEGLADLGSPQPDVADDGHDASEEVDPELAEQLAVLYPLGGFGRQAEPLPHLLGHEAVPHPVARVDAELLPLVALRGVSCG